MTPGKAKSEYIVTVPQFNLSNATEKSSASKDSEGNTFVLQFQIRFLGKDELYSTFKMHCLNTFKCFIYHFNYIFQKFVFNVGKI